LTNWSTSRVCRSRDRHPRCRQSAEECGLALHDGLCRQRPEIAKPKHRGTVRNDRHKITLRGVVEGRIRLAMNAEAREGHTGRIGKRQIALRGQRLGRCDRQLAARPVRMKLQRLVLGRANGPGIHIPGRSNTETHGKDGRRSRQSRDFRGPIQPIPSQGRGLSRPHCFCVSVKQLTQGPGKGPYDVRLDPHSTTNPKPILVCPYCASPLAAAGLPMNITRIRID